MKRYLAFDLGAESGRAIVGTLENRKLALDEIHRFPTGGMHINGTFRWDIYRLYEEVKEGIKKYVQKYGPEVESIGVDTWGVDFGLLDRKGQLIGIPYHYRDSRTEGTDTIIEEVMGKENLYRCTGIQFLIINTLNQLISMVKSNDPSLEIATDMLFIGDLLHYFLTGRICTEYTVASISQLYDVTEDNWSDKIFNSFKIPDNLKTRIIRAGERIGKVRDDVARETGISENVWVTAPPVHDTASAAVAIPAIGDDWAYISSGTWSIAGLELEKPVINKESFEMNISNSGGALGKSLFLKNVMGLWIIQQCKKIWDRKEEGLNYSEIVGRAQRVEGFLGYIDPDDSIFLNPENMPVAVSEYLSKTGQKAVDPGDIGAIAHIVYVSLALKYKYVFEKLSRAASKKINAVHITGGGSKNEMLNQFTANAMGVKVITGPVEATAIGNIMMQAYGSGILESLDDIRKVIRDSFEVKEYEAEDCIEWSTAYKQFLKICNL
ncbi:MAG: rhamnulokinase [Acetivibrionales bacterium]